LGKTSASYQTFKNNTRKKERGEIPRKSLTQDNPLIWNPAPSFEHLDYSPEKACGAFIIRVEPLEKHPPECASFFGILAFNPKILQREAWRIY